jgi:hypothetical protein
MNLRFNVGDMNDISNCFVSKKYLLVALLFPLYFVSVDGQFYPVGVPSWDRSRARPLPATLK